MGAHNKAKQIIIGPPMEEETQMGPLCTLKQLTNIEEKVKQTVQDGGK